ncbi:photosynthetic complex assembly protein PuhC [Acidiphilium sp.]|uniref:photosynthetic complex assembly protein PuhC n=1 Tax=Acidiphilium sp. TaxID=527 RepID=UPI003D01A3C1
MSGAAHHHDDEAPYVPRWAVIAAGCAMVGTILLATVARLTTPSYTLPTATAPIMALRFIQTRSQALIVQNAATGRRVTVIAPADDAFLRTTLRTMIETRDRDGISRTAPFLLVPAVRGALILDDPATGEHIDLQAFGPSNAGQFKALMVNNGDKS